MNLYTYVSNIPTIELDPFGLRECCGGSIILPIGIGWGPPPSITITISIIRRLGGIVLCPIAEREVAAIVRGHVDEAWRIYTDMDGTRTDPVVLSDSDMKEVFEDFRVREEIIEPLIEECKYSERGWKDRKDPMVKLDYSSFGYGESYYSLDGSWGAALGTSARFIPITTCWCHQLSWKIELKEKFDFAPLLKKGKWSRSIVVITEEIVRRGLDCDWHPFWFEGTRSGEEPCPF